MRPDPTLACDPDTGIAAAWLVVEAVRISPGHFALLGGALESPQNCFAR